MPCKFYRKEKLHDETHGELFVLLLEDIVIHKSFEEIHIYRVYKSKFEEKI